MLRYKARSGLGTGDVASIFSTGAWTVGVLRKVRRAQSLPSLSSNQLQDLALGGDGRREAERHERHPEQQIKQDFHGWNHRVLGACRSGTH